MVIWGQDVRFDSWDLHFVQTFGLPHAVEMVLDYRCEHPLPFVYDTYQLAGLLKIPRGQLFALTRRADRAYHTVEIAKPGGGKRRLMIPDSQLRTVQHRILRQILDRLPVSSFATAYHRGANLTQNAAPHAGKRYLLKLDIADFFGSIRFSQVYAAAFHTGHFPVQIGAMLTRLCCRNEVLPQGAPTSPALSNLVMARFDAAIGAWCGKRGIAYTRYCDDMTFSSDTPLWQVYQKVSGMLADMGFSLNPRKTRFLTDAGRKTVTGLTVNDGVRVPSDYKRRLRQEVYYACKFGLSDSIVRGGKTAFMENGVPNEMRYWQHLRGKIGYVLQIEPDHAAFTQALERLYAIPITRERDGVRWRFDLRFGWWRECPPDEE